MIRYLLAALLCAVPVSAWAQFGVEVSAGTAYAGVRSNGTWYQQDYPYTMQRTSQVVEADLRWSFTPHDALLLGAVNLGRYSVNSQDNPNDAAYAARVKLPLSNYIGSGRLWGFQALAEHTWGDRWQIGIRGGLLAYRETWQMDVPNWYPSDPGGTKVWYTPRETVGGYNLGPIIPIHTIDRRWALGGVVGVTLSHRHLLLALEYVKDGASFSGHHGAWPPIWSSHVVALFGVTF